ncbi:hypothetical protein GGR51DRAFT_540877 [Nemania sp. FL0031]|nr:hypothetical protein GGR51DRAFT_540877 [Nemania sp. FL0031]
MITTSAEPLFPSLTSIFTPSTLCSYLYWAGCVTNCISAISGSLIADFGMESSCHPESTTITTTLPQLSSGVVVPLPWTTVTPLFTYSPGNFCPMGMTIATHIQSLDAACCCYSGYNYSGNGLCTAALTEGSFLDVLYPAEDGTYSTISFGPVGASQFTSWASRFYQTVITTAPTIQVEGTAILLLGQQSNLTRMSSSMSRVSNVSGNNFERDRVSTSLPIEIGVGVGVSVGPILLVCLGFLFLKRYRRKRMGQLNHGDIPSKEMNDDYNDKPELEGSVVHRGPFIKAELDALAIRAELEGSPGEEYDAVGVGVLKPELHGTPGVPGRIGVFVKRKAELGASSNLGTISRTAPSAPHSLRNEPGTKSASESVELDY